MLRVDQRNQRAADHWGRLEDVLAPLEPRPDLCVVVGGDGWMLACIHELGPTVTYLGINAGSVGFLLNDVRDADDAAALLDSFKARAFPTLQMRAETLAGDEIGGWAVSDIYVERTSGQTAKLRVLVDGEVVVPQLVSDGMVVATALGSTAYNFSAGGAACHPWLRAVNITPICAHLPRLSPLVCPEGTVVDIEVLGPERRPVRVVTDGIDHAEVRRLRVEAGPDEVHLAFRHNRHFGSSTIRKILRT